MTKNISIVSTIAVSCSKESARPPPLTLSSVCDASCLPFVLRLRPRKPLVCRGKAFLVLRWKAKALHPGIPWLMNKRGAHLYTSGRKYAQTYGAASCSHTGYPTRGTMHHNQVPLDALLLH